MSNHIINDKSIYQDYLRCGKESIERRFGLSFDEAVTVLQFFAAICMAQQDQIDELTKRIESLESKTD